MIALAKSSLRRSDFTGSTCGIYLTLCCLLTACTALAGAEDLPFLCLQTGGHTGRVRALQFVSSDQQGVGTRLISAGRDKSVRVWQVGASVNLQDEAETTFRYNADAGVRGEVWATAYDAKSRLLALGTRAGIETKRAEHAPILIVDPDHEGVIRQSLKDPLTCVTALAFSPDGKHLVACDVGHAYIYETQRWTLVKTLGFSSPSSLAFAPQGDLFAVGTASSRVHLCNLAGKEIQRLELKCKEESVITCLAWGAGNTLAAGDDKSHLVLWQDVTRNGSQAPLLPDNKRNALCLAFDSKGTSLAIGLDDAPPQLGQIVIWSAGNQQAVEAHGPVTAVAFSNDNRFLASGDAIGEVLLWRMDDLAQPGATPQRAFTGSGQPAYDVAWSGNDVLTWKTSLNAPPQRAFNLRGMIPQDISSVQQVKRQTLLRPDAEDGTLTVAAGVAKIPAVERDGDRWQIGTYDAARKRVFAVTEGEPKLIYEYDISARKAQRLRTFAGCTGEVLGLSVSPDGRYLAAGGSDQVVRLWNVVPGAGDANPNEQQVPLISLLMTRESQWVAWNPETGFYKASDLGDEVICYQFNDPANAKCAEVVPVSTCPVFNNPDVMSELFKSGSIQAAKDGIARMTMKAPLQQQIALTPKIDFANITVSSVGGNERLRQEDLTKKVTTDLNPIVLDVPLLGGAKPDTTIEITPLGGGGRGLSRHFTGPAPVPGDKTITGISLHHGINLLRVLAKNQYGSSVPRIVRVDYQGTAAEQRGKLHVLAIGVSAYPNLTEGEHLKFAARDAESIRDFFQNHAEGLYTGVDAVALTDQKATRGGIEKALRDLQVQPQDTIVFFLAGHGVPPKQVEGDPDYYFAPNDFVRDRLDTGVSWKFIIGQLEEKHARRTFLFVDHCFAGGINSILNDPNNQERAATHLFKSLENSGSFFAFTAAQPNEKSYEGPDWDGGHGVFTYVLLKLLSGKGYDPAQDGVVTVSDIEHSCQRLTQKALAQGGEEFAGVVQTPKFLTPGGRLDSDLLQTPIVEVK